MTILKNWDLRCAENSIATTLAVEWGYKLQAGINKVADGDRYTMFDMVARRDKFVSVATAADLLTPLAETIKELQAKFGTWQVAWGDINRYQRMSTDIDEIHDDAQPSDPVAYTSSTWGMLPSFTSRYYPGTKKRYGYNGNSFICAVEFGKKIKAKSLLTGGESGDINSKHFNDQKNMYSKGQFKDVLFYKEDVMKHAEKTYHPGS